MWLSVTNDTILRHPYKWSAPPRALSLHSSTPEVQCTRTVRQRSEMRRVRGDPPLFSFRILCRCGW
ncbi:hypothetical protein CI102_3057 [Trichoderma harzianum]|uniref:Uncharacterized protein n=1 Tax=Trichoderma harzianum CBS 226.95 TaxID=983964 RepID=A0A2T4ACG6_TRIHA|nr:hypothetical protein M431DRAFT_428113 [Trichoderma harzianum CBS 226.95]PKK52899.1 hypothetical protein CI102_3057 [Trichoderma harzianum]PTB54775.1 hypothetical protein M431DRAFT_428113 [Trichoderma harzianum CBS 226.95]